MMRERFLHTICLILSVGMTSYGQLNIELSPTTLDFTTDCIEIDLGTSINFSTSSSCGGNTAITLDRGAQFLFETGDRNFSYLFDQLGEYTLLCNLSTVAIGTSTVCINVVEQIAVLPPGVIPTINEWGIIILMLLIIIVAATSIVQKTYSI